MQDQSYENKGQFIDDILLLVNESIHYRFLEAVSLRKPKKPVLRKKAALTQFHARLLTLKEQEAVRNQLTEDELKDIARTFFILLLQKNFFTLTYENWAADFILKELNTNGAYENLRQFLFPRAQQLEHAETQAPLLSAEKVKYPDVRKFICKGQNDKKVFSIWNRQTTFSAFWKSNSATGVASQLYAPENHIVPHAERLLFAAKILGITALLALATMTTLLTMGVGSPLLIVMVGVCVASLFGGAWIVSKKVAKDKMYENMHPNEENYHKTLTVAA